jgi:hypothetical protein
MRFAVLDPELVLLEELLVLEDDPAGARGLPLLHAAEG